MPATIERLLPVDEQALLKAYVEGSEPADAAALYDVLEVPHDAVPPRLAMAVAQILLHHIQGTGNEVGWALSSARRRMEAVAPIRRNRANSLDHRQRVPQVASRALSKPNALTDSADQQGTTTLGEGQWARLFGTKQGRTTRCTKKGGGGTRHIGRSRSIQQKNSKRRR
jgi:hypothetical protein